MQSSPVDIRGIDFVGYVFRHRYTKLRKNIKKNMFRKVITQSKHIKNTKTCHDKIAAYYGWLKYCNSKQLKIKLNSYYGEEIFRV